MKLVFSGDKRIRIIDIKIRTDRSVNWLTFSKMD